MNSLKLSNTSSVCLLVSILFCNSHVYGDTRYVSPEGSAESPFLSWKTAARDLESALDTAQDGDVILVGPGNYAVARTLVIRKAITIKGATAKGTVILDGSDAPRDSYCFDIQSPRAIVSGLTIMKFGGGIRFNHREGTSAMARNCVIVNNDGHGLFFNHGGCAKNCTVAFNRGAGLYAYDMGGGGDSPANLILYKNGSDFVRESANISLRNSFTKNPHFVSDEDFRLRADSPCIDAGRNEGWMVNDRDAGGMPRIQNDIVDIGAFELQPPKSHTREQVKNETIEMKDGGAAAKLLQPSPQAAKAAVEQYLAEIKEIEHVAAERKAQAKKRLENALKQLDEFQSEKGKRFHGMLGSYFDHQGRIPFIMLSVPNGKNALGEGYRNTVNAARFDSAGRLYKFEAQGHVSIPNYGSYRLQVSRAAAIKLNDVTYRVGAKVAGQEPFADVELNSGVYKVTFLVGNNGGQLGYSNIRIINNQTRNKLPIFVYETELDQFRNDLSLGVRLRETTGWNREKNALSD